MCTLYYNWVGSIDGGEKLAALEMNGTDVWNRMDGQSASLLTGRRSSPHRIKCIGSTGSYSGTGYRNDGAWVRWQPITSWVTWIVSTVSSLMIAKSFLVVVIIPSRFGMRNRINVLGRWLAIKAVCFVCSTIKITWSLARLIRPSWYGVCEHYNGWCGSG